MKKNYISEVIERFFKGKHSVDTNIKVQQWLIEEENKKEKEEILYKLWEDTDNSVNHKTLQALNKVKTDLGMKKSNKNQSRIIQLKISRIASVIVLILLLTGGGFYFYYIKNTIEYTTMKGEMETIDLPDGSKVWLNAGSTISYRDKYRKRTVKLSGEAFFKVKSDSLKPFIVETNTIITEVLGTEFNIEDYPDNPKTMATLSTGKIKISLPGNSNDFYVMEPDQQFIYSISFGVEIQQVHADEIKSWKEGNLIFQGASFKDIIHKLERHFNLKIIIYNADSYNDYYTIKFMNGEDIGQIMDILKITIGDFSYEIVE